MLLAPTAGAGSDSVVSTVPTSSVPLRIGRLARVWPTSSAMPAAVGSGLLSVRLVRLPSCAGNAPDRVGTPKLEPAPVPYWRASDWQPVLQPVSVMV